MSADCIALVGPRAAGKSTLGAALAESLGWPVHDTDELIAGAVGCAVGEHLGRVGEQEFRRDEERVCLGPLVLCG